MLIVLNLIVSLIIEGFAALLHFDTTGITTTASSFVPAIIVAYIYAAVFKEAMPKKLRLNVVSIYMGAQLVVAFMFFYLILFVFGDPVLVSDIIKFLPIGLIGLLVIAFAYGALVYWLLGKFSKIYLGTVGKKK